MMVSLKYKTLVMTIIPLTLILLIIGGLTIYNKADTERELRLNRLSTYITLLESGDLTFSTSADKAKLEDLFNEKVEFSEILDRDYKVKYSSENLASPLISDQDKKDIDDAFLGIETTKNIEGSEGKKTAFVIISPLIVNKKVVAVLHIGLSNEKSSQRVMDYSIYITFLTVGGIGICFVLISLLLNNIILKNIYSLNQATIKMQEGKMDTPIGIKTDDEIGALANTFDSMRLAIKSQKEQLEEYSKSLEEKVKERTQQLESMNDELKGFNTLAVGRELKMVELKKRVEELEEKSSKKET